MRLQCPRRLAKVRFTIKTKLFQREEYPMKIMKMAAMAMMSAVAVAGLSATADAGEFDGVTINILTRPGPVIAGPLKERGLDFEKETGAKIVVNEVPFAEIFPEDPE
jgi:multiple sugar transport system substrate-binding protein